MQSNNYFFVCWDFFSWLHNQKEFTLHLPSMHLSKWKVHVKRLTWRSTKANLKQYRCKNLLYSLIEGGDGRFQHGGHQEAPVKVVFCDHSGMQFEEYQHLLFAIPRSLNLIFFKNGKKNVLESFQVQNRHVVKIDMRQNWGLLITFAFLTNIKLNICYYVGFINFTFVYIFCCILCVTLFDKWSSLLFLVKDKINSFPSSKKLFSSWLSARDDEGVTP